MSSCICFVLAWVHFCKLRGKSSDIPSQSQSLPPSLPPSFDRSFTARVRNYFDAAATSFGGGVGVTTSQKCATDGPGDKGEREREILRQSVSFNFGWEKKYRDDPKNKLHMVAEDIKNPEFPCFTLGL